MTRTSVHESGTTAAAGEPALRVRNLGKTYGSGDGSVTAVDGVSFTIERGSVVGLLGPNGAGKTTTIKSILGLVVPTTGEVAVHGVDPFDRPRAAYERVSAVLEGARNVYWRLTVRENLRFFTGIQGFDPDAYRDRHDELLEMLDLTEKADEPVQTLSRGMKQKVALACALVRETPVTFLDEPTLGLDVETSRQLRAELDRLTEDDDRTVVLSSHDMDVIEQLCDRVIIMNDGGIVADDTVENLVDLFRSQAYRVALAEEVGNLRRELDGFDVYEWDRGGDGIEFEVSIADSAELYALVDALRDAGADVTDVSSVEPDLEEAFLAITDDRREVVAGGEPR